MGRSISRMLTIVLVVIGADAAFAQTAPAGPFRPASLGLLGGFSGGAGDTGGSVGGALAFDITDRVGVEGRGIYMQRGSGSTGLEATGTLLLTVARTDKVAPYVAMSLLAAGSIARASTSAPIGSSVRWDHSSRPAHGSSPFAE